MPSIRISSGQLVMVDAEDIELLSSAVYYMVKKTGRVQRSIYSPKLKKTTGHKGMANDALGMSKSSIILFKNGNKLDVRKANLLPVASNKRNYLAKLSKANTSGYHGVSFNSIERKYEAYLRKDYKKYSFGHFSTPEQAALAYNKGAIKHFGKNYSKLNRVD